MAKKKMHYPVHVTTRISQGQWFKLLELKQQHGVRMARLVRESIEAGLPIIEERLNAKGGK